MTSSLGTRSGGGGTIGARLALGGALAICVALFGGCVGAASPAVTSPGGSAPLPTATVSGPTTAPPAGSSAGPASPGPSQRPSSPPATPRPTATPLPRPTATVTPTASATPPGAAAVVVTLADNRTTMHVAVGQQFLVDLGSTVDWTVTIADQGIARRVPGVLVIRGAQGIYAALAPGTTTLSAIGSPVCTSGACPQFRIAFSITIVVG